jgi:polyisoprenoid-binding protein YceI
LQLAPEPRIYLAMNKRTMLLAALPILLLACKDPAKDQEKATVSSAVAPVSAPAVASATSYAITPASSKVEWTGSKVTGSHDGSFTAFSGNVDYAGSVEKSVVSIDIDATTITTTPQMLLDHLKSPDFFDTAKFPKASFVSTSITQKEGTTYTVTGNLDLHGTKKAISFPATITANAEGVDAKATFSINRKDFGINYAGKANDLIRDDVVIKLTVHGEKKPKA